MNPSRRSLIVMGAGLVASALAPVGAFAQNWAPARLTLRVGFNPGGSADTIGRLAAASFEQVAGWGTVVENVGGGGGIVMATGLSRERADGSVIGMGVSSAMAFGLAGDPNLPFKLDDFDFLGTVAISPAAIMAGADAPFDDMRGLVDWARTNSGAVVGVNERGAELIVRAIAKAENVNIKTISTRGGAEVLQNILGGHIQAGFDGGRHVDYMTSGDMKMLAAATNERHSYAPNVKTLKEQGFDYALEPWFIMMAPKGLPEDAKAAIAAQIDAAAKSDEVGKAVMNTFGIETRNLGSEGAAAMMADAFALAQRLTAENG
ncbi:hypothetical protein LXM94_07470 [Rhizobium sp. TRM95111]|uniref:Bug family tripartite tricarboxylate transporter substrate binding protein n=1 Tax=Rhizobium alarense TaxID=2846851 RepID=UPI001F321541|nr:tripartite tricarboxylate transporter substrate-binding protein [Rhizobium alarense]MCF3639807.1 hypothetical protein [Rhizobium alarense]